MCQAARIVAVGFVGRKRLQRLTSLPALDTDHRHTASGQAVMEHRGHTAGLEHDPPTGRCSGQRGFDVGGRRRYLHLVNDRAVSVHDAHVRLFHRHVQSSEIVHGRSPLPMTEPILSVSGKSCRHYPMLQKSQNAERLIFRERTKQAAIADRCSLKRAAEVACEFVAGCSSPPHQYSIAAPTARRICAPCCKKTFATLSAKGGSERPLRSRRWRGPEVRLGRRGRLL